MDPNGDGFITSTNTTFTGPLDATEFELPFIPFPQYEPEPSHDNQNSEGCRFYELVDDPSTGAMSGYYYYSNPDGIPYNGDELMIFRLRVASNASASSAFSVLIDTDYRFGFSGPEADPNAVTGNPGFEREITVYTNTGSSGGVRVWNVDGLTQGNTASFHGPTSSHFQVAYALNQSAGCTTDPAFVDFYIPFSSLGISSATQFRMAFAANDNVGTSLGGKASDIGGVDALVLPDHDEQFLAVINNFSPADLEYPANVVPISPDGSTSIDENTAAGTPVHTVSGSDPNGDPVSYSIARGNTASAFAIHPSSGVITVNNSAALDFENTPVYTLVVNVSDGRLYDNAIVTIQLLNVNEPPVGADAEILIDENLAFGSLVHSVQAVDPDADTELNYSIIEGNEDAAFEIVSSSGDINVFDPALLDFEAGQEFSLTVRISDGTLFTDVIIKIGLNDLNESPSVSGGRYSIAENTQAGFVITSVSGSDPDAGTVLSYSISSGNTTNAFTINSTTGEIAVYNSAALDFETTPVFTLEIVVSDGDLSGFADVVISLTDVNEPPALVDATVTLNDLFSNDEVVFTVTGMDPDAGDVLSYAIEEGDDGFAFLLDPATGALRIQDAVGLFRDLRTIELLVSVTDSRGLTDTGTIFIEIRRVPGRDDIRPLKGFSPNGDGNNDFWIISGIELFPESIVRVFNRWGMNVFEMQGYDNHRNAWKGEDIGSSPETTYFYVIQAGDFQPITGYLIVKP